MKGRVLVTGAYGLLGSHTVRELIGNGYKVRAFGRDPAKLAFLASEYEGSGLIETFTGDLRDAGDVDRACEGMDYVIHCGAMLKNWGRRSDFMKTNVEGTRNVLDACSKHGVKRLVFTSSPSVRPLKNDLCMTEDDYNEKNRLGHYIESKICAEKLVKSREVPYAIIRPRGVTGIGDKNMIPALLKVNSQIGIPLFDRGRVVVDLLCASNAAMALRLCMEKDEALGQVYNITNGEPKKITELAEELSDALGIKIKFIRLPFMPVYAAAYLLESVWKLLRIYDKAPPVTRMDICTLGRSQIFSIEKAKRELGYEPKESLSEFMKKYAEVYVREQGQA